MSHHTFTVSTRRLLLGLPLCAVFVVSACGTTATPPGSTGRSGAPITAPAPPVAVTPSFVAASATRAAGKPANTATSRRRAHATTKTTTPVPGAVTKVTVTDTLHLPGGRRTLISVVSPDVNGDGYGTTSLRLIDSRKAGHPTLATYLRSTFKVDKRGVPQQEIPSYRIVGLFDDHTPLIMTGCCSEADVAFVNVAKPPTKVTWFRSSDPFFAAKLPNGHLVATRPVETKDADGTYFISALRAYDISPRNPKGALRTTVSIKRAQYDGQQDPTMWAWGQIKTRLHTLPFGDPELDGLPSVDE